METLTINSLKDALSELNISTSTSGVRGEERRQILIDRLREAQGNDQKQQQLDAEEMRKYANLGMTAIRRELERKGISTMTPGLKLSERRKVLLKRLSDSDKTVKLDAEVECGVETPSFEVEPKQHAKAIFNAKSNTIASLVHGDSLSPKENKKPTRRSKNVNIINEMKQMEGSFTRRSKIEENKWPEKGEYPSTHIESRKIVSEDECNQAMEDEPTIIISNGKTGNLVDIQKETSPSKRQQLKNRKLIELRNEVNEIRRVRIENISLQLNMEELNDVSNQLGEVQLERRRIYALHEDTCVTRVLSGKLEEYSTKDIFPMLLTLEGQLRRKQSLLQQKERDVRRKERESSEYGIAIEQEKLKIIRELEEELNISSFNTSIGETNSETSPRRKSFPSSFIPSTNNKNLDDADMNLSMKRRKRISSLNFRPATLSEADKLGQKAHYLQRSKHDFDQAEDLYKEALTLDQSHSQNLGNYALFLQLVRKKFDEAEEFFLRSIDADAKNVTSISNYANFLRGIRKDDTRAEEYFLLGIQTNPKHVGNLGNYANFLRRARKNYQLAEQYYLQAIEIEPKHANNLGQYASMLVAMKKNDKAQEFYEKAINTIGVNAHILGNYANFLKQTKEIDKAKEMYLKALTLNRNDAVISQNYAIFLRDFPEMRTGVTSRISTPTRPPRPK